jgi:hypothetical protein
MGLLTRPKGAYLGSLTPYAEMVLEQAEAAAGDDG